MTRSNRAPYIVFVLVLLIASALSLVVGFGLGDRYSEGVRQRIAAFLRVAAPGDWRLAAETDLPRYDFMRVALGDSLLIFGGFFSEQTKASLRVEVLNLKSGSFSRRKDMPVGLTHATPARLGDEVWIAGGFEGDHPGTATARVWRYSIANDSWLSGPSLPAARAAGTLVAIADTLFYSGGYLADRNTDSPDHWALAPGDSVWRMRSPLPTARGHLSSVAMESSYYAISGNSGHDLVPTDVRVVEHYDAVNGQWTTKRSTPFSVSHTEPSTQEYAQGIITAGGRAREIGRENNHEVLWYLPASDQWRFVTRGPVSMLGGLGVVHQDTLYFGMGASRGSVPTTRAIWKKPLRDTWHIFDSLPVSLGEVAAGVIGDSMYLVGDNHYATLIFDLASGKWLPLSQLPVRPAQGHHHAAEVIDNKWYLFGGLGARSQGLVQMFDPVAGSWLLLSPMPFAAGSSASAVINGKVYVAGGIVDKRTTNSAAVYDPTTDSWELIAHMPRGRNHAASGTDGNKLFVFGGRGPGSGDSNVVANGFADVQIYDPSKNIWSVSNGSENAPSQMPQARGGMGKAVYLNGEFWIIGGETLDGAGANKHGTYSRVDIYNPTTNEWRLGPGLPTARHGIFPVEDHGRIIVVGGGVKAGHGSSSFMEVLWPLSQPNPTGSIGQPPR